MVIREHVREIEDEAACVVVFDQAVDAATDQCVAIFLARDTCGVSDETSVDISISDVFARGVMSEVGKSFVPEKLVSEGFEDYEGAYVALGRSTPLS